MLLTDPMAPEHASHLSLCSLDRTALIVHAAPTHFPTTAPAQHAQAQELLCVPGLSRMLPKAACKCVHPVSCVKVP